MLIISICILFFSALLSYGLPLILWQISWHDLDEILFNRTTEADLLNRFSYIFNGLGITENNLHNWAIERVFIILGLGILTFVSLFIFFYLFYKVFKNNNSKTE